MIAVDQEYAFQIKNLNVWYGDNQTVKNLSMNMRKNRVTAIIGPSGCGKSTLLKTLNHMVSLIPHTKVSGEVIYEDKNIYGETVDLEELRTKIGMVFQKPAPFLKSIYENVAFGARIHGENKKSDLDERVERCLKQVALWDEVKDRLDKSAIGLSGGQQQRLCIARCLAVEPNILLMDEPTSALDPIATLKIEELLQELKKKYSIVIVTHNMQQAARASDDTAFMLNGELVELAPTGALFSAPKNQTTEDYVMGKFG
ncbi:phosphate ABC transporter ATP-binding protein PstB [Fictibacillus iocasae]|uniref:Phosphate ABC transporter ATP-binding protein PstB n=1 Tax=Fictibacillus iocasae TaxID=2715437 RepID=A0ABW2NKW5_9BACL